MDPPPLTQTDVVQLRQGFIFTLVELFQLFSLVLKESIPALDAYISKLAADLQTRRETLLYHARDGEGRNVVHYASIAHGREVLEYFLSPALISKQQTFLRALLQRETKRGENTALYAIQQRCPPSFLDRIITAAGPSILETTTKDGLGPLHCAVIADAPDLILLLVQMYHLDPNQPVTRAPGAEDTPYVFPQPVVGDTPMHLAARHDSGEAFTALYEELGVAMDSPRNSAGESPFDVAVSVNAKAVFKLFGLMKISTRVAAIRRRKGVKWQSPGKRRAEEMN